MRRCRCPARWCRGRPCSARPTRRATTTGRARTRYPTSGDFTAGSFDLTGHAGSTRPTATCSSRSSSATLVPTFGNAFGAQMLDLYVHNPAVTTTSTAPAFPQRNYTIAPADAWSERVEVQGFVAAGLARRRPATRSARRCSSPTTAPRRRRSTLPIAQFGTVGRGVDVHGCADRSGRVQPRSGARRSRPRRRTSRSASASRVARARSAR